MLRKFHSCDQIIKDIAFDFLFDIRKYQIKEIKRDFSNLFFLHFIKHFNDIISNDSEIKIVYSDDVKGDQLYDFFIKDAIDEFLKKFYRKISRLFPANFISLNISLDGNYLDSELDYSIIEKVLNMSKRKNSFRKINKEINKKINNAESLLKMQNFCFL